VPPPPAFEDGESGPALTVPASLHGEHVMTRRDLFKNGVTGAADYGMWTREATETIIYNHDHNRPVQRVAFTKNGRCYHHVSCRTLFASGNQYRAMTYHKGTIIVTLDELEIFNSTRKDTHEALAICGYCWKKITGGRPLA
jgi:hypothetical protein